MSEQILGAPFVHPGASPEVTTPIVTPQLFAEASPQPSERSLSYKTRKIVGKIGAGTLILLPGASAGAATAIGVAEMPAHIKTGIPGVSAEARLQVADWSGISYGPTVGLPEVHEDILGIPLGANVDITELDTHNAIDKQQAGAAIAHDPGKTLGPEVSSALLWRAGEGVAAGLGMFGVIEYGRRRIRRHFRTQPQGTRDSLELLQQIEKLPDDVVPAELRDSSRRQLAALQLNERKHTHHTLSRRVATITAELAITAASWVTLHHEAASLAPPEASRTVIFPADSNDTLIQGILAEAPKLKGAFVTGDLGYYGREALVQLGAYIQKTDDYWKNQATTLVSTTLPEFKAKGGMAWQENPNIIAIAHVTDIHDDRPYMQYFLPTAFAALGVDIVANSGDQMNFSGKSFLDDGADDRMADTLPTEGRDGGPVLEVESNGNHDPEASKDVHDLTFKTSDGKKYHPITPLDKEDGYTTTVRGITFVGSPDLNRTITQTIPSDHDGQMANDAKQGELLAEEACKVYKETGDQPILLAHEQQATYEAIAKGCVKLALSGHLHETQPTHVFVNPDSSITYQQTLGSASGDGANNTAPIYGRPTTTSTMEIWLYNKATGSLLRHTIFLNLDPNGGLSLEKSALPAPDTAVPAMIDPDVQEFFDSYAPDVQSQLQASASEPK